VIVTDLFTALISNDNALLNEVLADAGVILGEDDATIRSVCEDVNTLTFNRITDYFALTKFQRDTLLRVCSRFLRFKIDNAELLGIPAKVYPTRIFESAEKEEKHPCFLCARLRRGWLYKKAQELGCNKIALGNHFDDVIETILMGMLYGSQMQTMMPKLKSENYEGVELIRPLYLVRESDIIAWRDFNSLEFIRCACKVTEKKGEDGSKRAEIKKLIAQLKQTNPAVEMNIFRSPENVNLRTLISYHDGSEHHHFLDEYR
jgi:tRNA(Ile)-lysidine synthase TilS/MesJ